MARKKTASTHKRPEAKVAAGTEPAPRQRGHRSIVTKRDLHAYRKRLEAELAELTGRRDGILGEQAEVTKARDAVLVEIDRELDAERAARDALAPSVGEELGALYDQLRARHGGVGAAALVGNTCQGCRVSISPVELAAVRRQPPEAVKRCENCRRILVVE